MTAEIAIMNRNAIVLAADSATTVTSWNNGQVEKRYFKGANKLFELTRHSPVGLMIYGSASLHGVPWELVIKAFREDLKSEKHDALHGYAAHFFEYVQRNERLFPAEAKSTALVELIGGAAFRLQALIATKLGLAEDGPFEGLDEAAVTHAIDGVEQSLDERPVDSPLVEADISAAVASMGEVYKNAVGDRLQLFLQGSPEVKLLAGRFAEVLIKLALKEFKSYAPLTGIVVAGYGKDDYYPSLEVFQCYGFIGDRLLFQRSDEESKAMDTTAEAVIQPFATTSMIETFRFGVSPDIVAGAFGSIRDTLQSFAKDVVRECENHSGITDGRLEELVGEAADEHSHAWVNQMRNMHFLPLSKVIHSLPIQDMAALAQSLIELESLKERVTKPSESVSGPIDVAVISKHDGFVWLERKHYFRPELNPRFFNRRDYV